MESLFPSNKIIKRKEELQSYLCQLIADITPDVPVEYMDIPLSKEDIHHQTIIGAGRVPVVSLTIYIPREVVMEVAIQNKPLKVELTILIEDTCPEIYRDHLEKALNLNKREKRFFN
jgi:hypothetical protein